jgi:molybdopterin molybdotransferase
MIDFEEARTIVAALAPLGTERVAIPEAAGRTLAERIVAPEDLVPFARSAMDGFAVSAHDTRNAPVTLRISSAVYAEATDNIPHVSGTATAIATGGVIPDGADAVIPIEETIVNGGSVVIAHRSETGRHVFPPGEDARAGDELIERGAVLDAPRIGLLAAAGITDIQVYRQPRVAVITTGNELVRYDHTPARGQIRDSNGLTLAAAARAFGAASVDLGTVADDRDAVRATLAHALDNADFTIVSGGASVGERDYVKAVCEELGVIFDFTSVSLRPARPTGFGRRGSAFVAVLPGNPAAAFVALHEFVRPALAALGGCNGAMPRITAELDGSLHAKGGRAFAVYARLRFSGGRFVATPLRNQCSALARLASDADGLIIIPSHAGDARSGDACEVDVIAWDRVFAASPAPTLIR